MNWLNTFGVAAGAALMIFALLRVERTALWVVLLILVGPGFLAIGRWASVRSAWPETLAGLTIAGLVTGTWWALIGRKSQRPSSDSIRVWGQERQPKPRPEDMAALQSENQKLKDDAARMQAELERLKNNRPRDSHPPGVD
jgi:hypothetical protein